MFYFTVFSKSSSVPCSLPLGFYSCNRLDLLTVSLGRYRHAISHCNSKLAEREVVKCAKRGYRVAESLRFQG